MDKAEIQNLIKDIIEKTLVKTNGITIVEESPKSMWVAVEVSEPHFFISRDGEGLRALNHLVHRILESKNLQKNIGEETKNGIGLIIDINGHQKKHVESVRAVAHMMSERARYFKSSVEIDPMSPFERRIVHEFLSNATDIKTESVGMGRGRRIVIRYIGSV